MFNTLTQLKRSWLILLAIDIIWITYLLSPPPSSHLKSQSEPCFSLIDTPEKKYYQWASSIDHPPFQSGQWRWIDSLPFSIAMPEIQRLNDQPFKVHRLSQGPPPEEANLIIIYDNWENRNFLKKPLQPSTQLSKQVVVFLDQSSTMNNHWKHTNISSHEMSLNSLRSQRKLSSEDWDMIGFGESSIPYGTWSAKNIFDFQKFKAPMGKTKWSEAVSTWLSSNPKPSHLVMIGDGKIDEQNIERVKQLLHKLKSLDHRVAILSPDLKPLDAWNSIYQNALADAQWPNSDNAVYTKLHSREPVNSTWEKVTSALPGPQHQALLWAKEGPLLISLEWHKKGPWLHFTGQPNIDHHLFLTGLKKHLEKPIVLELRPDRLKIDFQKDLKEPLKLLTLSGQKWVWPKQWGIYELHDFGDDLIWNHSYSGTMRLKNALTFQKNIFSPPITSHRDTLNAATLFDNTMRVGLNAFLAILHFSILFITLMFLSRSRS